MGETEYNKMSDEELVNLYRNGESAAADYLVEKYKSLVRMKSRTYFLLGADNEDLIQEGMIGLYKAIRDYNPGKATVFMTFASLCISRQINTAMTAYNRKKNSPLNSSISLDAPASPDEECETSLSDIIPSGPEGNPETLVIDREQSEVFFKNLFDSLSSMEKEVLELYKEGLSYTEIAKYLGKTPKTIDNAIQRIRNKTIKLKNA